MVGSAKVSRRRGVAAIGAAALLLVSTGCAAITGSSTREVVKIAADLELSGEHSALGETYRDALTLMVERVNEERRLGDRELRLEIVDNRSDEATSAGNIARLTGDPSVTALITGGCYMCLLSSVDTINERGVPTIALAAPDAVSNPVDERRFIFKLGPNAADIAAALASELGRADVSTVGLAVGEGAYGDDGLREMVAAIDRAGLELVAEERLTAGDGIAAAADRIADARSGAPDSEDQPDGAGPPSSGPDAVVVWADAGLAEAFAVDLRDAGYDGPLYLDATAANELFLAGDTSQGYGDATMIFTEMLVIDEVIATSPAKAARKTWFRDYTAEYGTYSAFASFAADAVQLVVEAVNRFDSTDRETVRGAIEATQMDGLTGPIRMTPDSHSGLMPQALATLVARGDRWRLAS